MTTIKPARHETLTRLQIMEEKSSSRKKNVSEKKKMLKMFCIKTSPVSKAACGGLV